MGTIAGERITATPHFDHNVTANLLEQRFPRVDSTAYMMELYGTEGRLLGRGGGAWWLPQPHHLPDGEHDRWEVLAPIYPEHYDPGSSASEDDCWFVEEYVRALDNNRDHECR